ITCTGVAGFGIDGTLTQGKGSRLVWGPFSAFGRCTGAPTRWATTLGSVTDLIFRNGSATYLVNADAGDIFACVNASRQGKVRLKMAHARALAQHEGICLASHQAAGLRGGFCRRRDTRLIYTAGVDLQAAAAE